jgi:hypothetical protein
MEFGMSTFSPLHSNEDQRPKNYSRIRLASFALCVTLGVLTITSRLIDRRVSSELDQADSADLSQQLWENSNSQHRNAYYNVFTSSAQTKRRWTSSEVRERVWQTLKDVDAMENHIEQQNIINARMKKEVAELESGLTREKRIVRLIINEGMDDVDQRLNLLQEAVSSNVSAVEETLRQLSAEARAKQIEQDQTIAALKANHITLAAQANKELNQVTDRSIARPNSSVHSITRVQYLFSHSHGTHFVHTPSHQTPGAHLSSRAPVHAGRRAGVPRRHPLASLHRQRPDAARQGPRDGQGRHHRQDRGTSPVGN